MADRLIPQDTGQIKIGELPVAPAPPTLHRPVVEQRAVMMAAGGELGDPAAQTGDFHRHTDDRAQRNRPFPICPSPLAPQQKTPPLTNAQECRAPLTTCVALAVIAGRPGLFASTVVPIPSCPCELSPQQITLPS